MKNPSTAAVALVALLTALASGPTSAQPHSGGILLGGGYPSNSQSYLNGIYLANRNGQLSTFVDTFTPTRPYYMDSAVMGNDNRSIVFSCRGSGASVYSLAYGVFRYDPSVNQFSTIARSTVAFQRIYGLTRSGDGDWFVNAQGRINNQTAYNVYRVRSNGTWSTVLTTVQLGHPQSFNYAIGRDIDSGDLLVPSSRSVGFFARPVYRVAPDGTVTTWNTSSNGPSPSYGWTQEIATGDMVYVQSRAVYRATQGRNPTSVKTIPSAIRDQIYGAVFDNQSVDSPQLITYGYQQLTTLHVANLHWVDPVQSTVTNTVQFLQANQQIQIPYPIASIENERANYIQPVRTGAGRWDVRLNVPSFAGKPYACVVGFSGLRPGIRLPGQRRAWLNFDPLVVATAQDRIRPLWNPGPFVLDANGKATAKIDLSFFPSPLGFPVHLLMVVIDPSAPGGLAFVTEPVVLNL